MDEEKDLFSELIKEKLVNYSFPVDDDSWDKMLNHLNQTQRKKTRQRWFAAIAVAASIAILLILFSINKKSQNYDTADQLPNNEETIIQVIPEKETVQPILSQAVESQAVFRKSQSRKQFANNELTNEVIPENDITKENQDSPSKEETTATEKKQSPPSSKFIYAKEEETPLIIKRKKQQSIRLSVGSGGNLLASNSSDITERPGRSPAIPSNPDILYFRAAAVELTEPRAATLISEEDFKNISYNLPLSFGITVKKELDRTFAIETGIVYSLLSTSFNKEFPRTDADLQLHYIGVPLNLHARIFGNRSSKCEIYLSAGGMVEKGVLSHYVQKNYYDNINNYLKTIVLNEKIEGFQWSVGVAPGVDYKLFKNYSIYLEPKFSYYFDNNQPMSSRTKNQVVVGMNAGLRYIW